VVSQSTRVDPQMPARLRPTAPIAADAILVGDPGRALLLAQELLEQPKMCNHARGLWGYSGHTPDGRELTVQATGIGGPSAAIVLADLAELGVRRAIRVGTCSAIDPNLQAGQLLTIIAAHAWGGLGQGQTIAADPELTAAMREELGDDAIATRVASLDTLHHGGDTPAVTTGEAADMQTAALFERGEELGVALAATLIVTETVSGKTATDTVMEIAAKRAGIAARAVLSA
jgi:uridine phosphorylase